VKYKGVSVTRRSCEELVSHSISRELTELSILGFTYKMAYTSSQMCGGVITLVLQWVGIRFLPGIRTKLILLNVIYYLTRLSLLLLFCADCQDFDICLKVWQRDLIAVMMKLKGKCFVNFTIKLCYNHIYVSATLCVFVPVGLVEWFIGRWFRLDWFGYYRYVDYFLLGQTITIS